MLSGQVRLAAVTVNALGVVAYWGPGARRLFGLTHEQAAGLPAAAILPVSGVIDAVGDGEGAGAAYAHYPSRHDHFGDPGRPVPGPAGALGVEAAGQAAGQPSSGRFWGGGLEDGPEDVLWWACPLVGPGLQRLLVLAADGTRLDQAAGGRQVAAGFAAHRDLPGPASRAALLRQLLADLEPAERADIVGQLLAQGYPVLHTGDGHSVPLLPRGPGAALPSAGTRA
jgi:hypothetical protein